MAKNDPVHQHYIPKSYLKNFAEPEGKLFFVDTQLRGPGEIIKRLPTRDICAEKNIYTFTDNSKGDAYALERWYAKEVDGIYPEVYNRLKDHQISLLHPDTKREILNTILSLHFRRPNFLKKKVKDLENLVKRITQHGLRNNGVNGIITVNIHGERYTFKDGETDEILAKKKKEYKEKWLVTHFAKWQDFISYKMKCGIEVITVPEICPLITSDNPVCIYDDSGNLNEDDPFNPLNMIEIPLDRRTYLLIHSNLTSDDSYKGLHRRNADEYFANSLNRKIIENSDNRIISYPGDLEKSNEADKKLDKFNSENVEAFGKNLKALKLFAEILLIKEQEGGLYNAKVAAKVKEARITGLLNDMPMFQELILDLAKIGFLTV